MSLVVNANEQDTNVLINKNIGQYPDIRQLLIAPSALMTPIPNYGGLTGHEAVRYVLPGFFMGNSSNANYGSDNQFYCTINMGSAGWYSGNMPRSLNVSSPKTILFLNSPFSEGEIIGKKILLKFFCGTNLHQSNTGGAPSGHQFSVGPYNIKYNIDFSMLHTDGTKTTFATVEKDIWKITTTTPNVYYLNFGLLNNTTRAFGSFEEISVDGNGIQTQEGDLLLIEFYSSIIGKFLTSNQSSNYSVSLYTENIFDFGCLGGIRVATENVPNLSNSTTFSGTVQPYPIQISMD